MDTNKVKELAASISWADILKADDFSIEKLWKMTAAQFFKGKNVSTTQYNEMRKAYFSGFVESFRVLTDYASDLPEDKACELFSKIAQQGTEFMDSQLETL